MSDNRDQHTRNDRNQSNTFVSTAPMINPAPAAEAEYDELDFEAELNRGSNPSNNYNSYN